MEDLITSTGAFESPHDYRDVPVGAVAGAVTIPEKFSIFSDGTKLPVWYQRKIGACVGHAAGKYTQYLNLIETKKIESLSARFLYALAKCRDGFTGEGTYPRLVAKILKDHGCATEALVPNDTKLSHEEYVFFRKESNIHANVFDEAKKYRIGGYAFATDTNSEEQIMQSIFLGKGCIALMRVGREWFTDKDGKTSWKEKDVLPIRIPNAVISGHEIFYTAYERINGRLKIFFLNSWSEDWASHGIGWCWHDEQKPYITEVITFVDLPNTIAEQLDSLPPAQAFKHSFVRDIEAGERSEEVKALQTALMIDGQFDKDLYASLLKTNELGYFKPFGVTQDALYRYQIAHSVASLSEINALKGKRAGAKTRVVLNAQFSK